MSGVEETRELLIIKKRAPLDEGAGKGGVWKIAFADFMTALMAFFLVMWLVNAANEETKVQVASYFNPVRLVDSKPRPRGLEDMKDDNDHERAPAAGAAAPQPGDGTQQVAPAPEKFSEPGSPAHEAALMRDPPGAFDRIAGVAVPDRGSAEGLDPFAPAHWPTPGAQPQEKSDSRLLMAGQEAPVDAKAGSSAAPPPQPAPAPPGEAETVAAKGSAGETKALEELAAAIREAATAGDGLQPSVGVEMTDEGVLVSLTDSADFGMFAIASAEPNARTIAMMDRLAGVLRSRNVRVVVRGHTDARPFRSEVYDNWRLSTARAHMAAYMLQRGGVDEARILRVEGHADRRLKRPEAPEADDNRRIELLVAPEGAP